MNSSVFLGILAGFVGAGLSFVTTSTIAADSKLDSPVRYLIVVASAIVCTVVAMANLTGTERLSKEGNFNGAKSLPDRGRVTVETASIRGLSERELNNRLSDAMLPAGGLDPDNVAKMLRERAPGARAPSLVEFGQNQVDIAEAIIKTGSPEECFEWLAAPASRLKPDDLSRLARENKEIERLLGTRLMAIVALSRAADVEIERTAPDENEEILIELFDRALDGLPENTVLLVTGQDPIEPPSDAEFTQGCQVLIDLYKSVLAHPDSESLLRQIYSG